MIFLILRKWVNFQMNGNGTKKTSLDTRDEIKDGSVENQPLQNGEKKKQNGSSTQNLQNKDEAISVDSNKKISEQSLEDISFDNFFDEVILEYIFSNEAKDDFNTFKKNIEKLLTVYASKLCREDFKDYHILFLWSIDRISDFHLHSIYRSLRASSVSNNERKNILLIIENDGGNIEHAFKISKLCNKYKKDKFVVAIPHKAKSAATLIAMGADEIYFGSLGELGPIDPQISIDSGIKEFVPALGFHDAFRALAKIVTEYPKSVDLFSRFLDNKISLEYFGLFTRLPQSAIQYAQILLSINHSNIDKKQIENIAKSLVETYKDHSFVIDAKEARNIFGKDIAESLIRDESPFIDKLDNFYYNLLNIRYFCHDLWTKPGWISNFHFEFVGKPQCRILDLSVKKSS